MKDKRKGYDEVGKSSLEQKWITFVVFFFKN